MEYLTREELVRLFKIAHDHNKRHHVAMLVGLLHGLRVSEMLAIRGRDICDGKLSVKRLKKSRATLHALRVDSDPLFDESPLLQLAQANPDAKLFRWSRQYMDIVLKRYSARGHSPLKSPLSCAQAFYLRPAVAGNSRLERDSGSCRASQLVEHPGLPPGRRRSEGTDHYRRNVVWRCLVKRQSELYPLLATLKRLGMEPTRQNYLSIDRWDNTTVSMRNAARQFPSGQLPSASAPAAMETKVRESAQPSWPSISENGLRFEGTRFLNEFRRLFEHILLSRCDQKKRALLNAGS